MYSPSTISLNYLSAFAGAFLVLLFTLRIVVRRIRARSISHLPGPPPGPWLVGNLPEILRPDNAAEAECAWTKSYGSAMRVKGALGLDVLLLTDPKAMQYILNTAGYHFHKPQQNTATSRLTTGEGLAWAQGAQHARQRKIINPAFSYTSLRVFLPLFRHTAQKAVSKWKQVISQGDTGSTVLDVPSWLARTTLDAMGAAAFDYEFGALDEADNELSTSFRNLFADSFYKRSDFTIIFEALWDYLPLGLVGVMQNLMPTKQLKRLRRYMKVARSVARNILDTQTQSHAAGKEGGKDVMSILIKANLSEDPKTKLSDDEIMAQLTTFILAGHETTASTMTWALYELSRHPGFQSQVREEIVTTRAKAAQRGDTELTVADLDSMKYLLSLMKETLRYHPIATMLVREAGREEVIPLQTPLTTKMGEIISSITVGKGQQVMLSFAAYNRLTSVWGEDADVWRPERFMEGIEAKQKTGLGVISNISTFSSGLRNCIGWRFALIEMQAVLIELIENFEFSPAPGNPEILRGAAGIVTPMVKGFPGRAQLPLTVTPVA